jgi:methyltransferase (TIGR00027 family)
MKPGTRSTTADFAATMRAAHLIIDQDPKILGDTLARGLSGFADDDSLRRTITALGDDLAAKLPGTSAETLMAATRAGITVRSRFAEDRLREAIDRGVDQYVILGAGLDSSAYRLPEQGRDLRVFEVDFPATQQWKRARLAELKPEALDQVTFVPIDFEKDSLFGKLAESGFDANRPAFFSWLGVVWYLTDRAILGTLREIAASAGGSEVVFEYPLMAELVDPGDRPLVEMVKQVGALRGEPVGSGFDPVDLVRKVEELGFETVTDVSPDDINARYFSDRADGLRMPGIGHLLSASVGQRWSDQFEHYDVSSFPIVRIDGARLPAGYSKKWVAEMEALLARGDPFAFVFLSSAEHPAHEDQKRQTQWLKRNKKPLAQLCRGAVAIEPDGAKRLLKRAQALVITTAFGLRFSVVPDRSQAEARAREFLAGLDLHDDED